MLFRETMNRQLESSVTTPENVYSVIVALSDVRFGVGGRNLGRDDLLLISPNTRLDVMGNAGFEALTIHIPADRIGDYDAAFGGVDPPVAITHMTLQHTPAMNVDAFRKMVLEIFAEPRRATTDGNMDWALIVALTDMLVGQRSIDNGHDAYGRLEKHRIMVRAREYIHQHLTDNIRITDLCKVSNVSLSTLERVFRRELDISPTQYVLATRLHEARRKIWATKAKSFTIAEIAMNCGFTHMSRFARQYQEHFGRLPSEDRQLGIHMNGEDGVS
jgi:AraC-like DNA-binding protein